MALQAVSRQLRPNERLFAFFDVCLTSKVDWVGACCTILEEKLRVHACTRIHLGKTRVWNQTGLRPPVCDVLERLARIDDPQDFQKSTGVASGHPPFVCQTFGEDINQAPGASRQKKRTRRNPIFGWVFLFHCACVRANHLLRVVFELQ